jgi:chromosome segregation ATPase
MSSGTSSPQPSEDIIRELLNTAVETLQTKVQSLLQESVQKISSRLERVEERLEKLEEHGNTLETGIHSLSDSTAATQTAVESLQQAAAARDREWDLLGAEMAMNRQGALRESRHGNYRRTAPVRPPTEAALSGFSFDPSIRKPAPSRYG